MGKYFRLQCKRMLRQLPGAMAVTLILLLCLFLAFRLFTGQNAGREENQRFSLAVCGETDHPFLQMGLTTLTSFDSSRFALEVLQMEESEAARRLAMGTIVAYVVIPEGFMDAAFSGQLLPIQFYTTAGASGIVSMMKEELSRLVTELLVSSQKGVFGLWDAMKDNGLTDKAVGQMDRLALVYVDYIFARDRICTLQELGIADALGLEDALLCGLCVTLLLLVCIPFAAKLIPGDPALGRMLSSKGSPAWGQAVCDFAAYALTLLCLAVIMIGAAGFLTPETGKAVDLFCKVLPVLLLAAAFSFMICSLSRDVVGGLLLLFFAAMLLCFVSGCLYPVTFFPVRVQQLAQWLPTGLARTQLAGFLTGSTPGWVLPLLLGYSLAFAAVGVWARVRHIREVGA